LKNGCKNIKINIEIIFMSCNIFKFNDYKKKQERGLLITNQAVYNLKGTDIKRRIEVEKIKAISFSKIGSEFILHVPS
jgi:serum/glucocorticoid-regulated kinase 2